MIKNISTIFRKNLIKNANTKVLGVKINNSWNWTDKTKLNNMISYSIDVLKDRNVNKGDRIVYKGKNSVEWLAWNIATLLVGGVWVPLYSNQKEEYCKYIVDDCNPKVLISDDNVNYKDINFMDNKIENVNYENEYKIINSNLCTLIYTSGTTGNPKGVMLSNENLLSNIKIVNSKFKEFENKELTSLNILPWAHIYGLTT